jgi:hypothetical protein
VVYLNPKSACLTKVGFEAGESFADILRRKDLERVSGGDVFWWGIGESKLEAIAHMRAKYCGTEVLFNFPSKLSTRPDRTGGGEHGGHVLVWRAYVDPDTGRMTQLPDHALVTSGAATKGGGAKSSYFALVCNSRSPLKVCPAIGQLKSGEYQNLKKDGCLGSRLQGSQTTLVLVRTERTNQEGPDDHITLIHYRAEFARPFVVSLCNPRRVAKSEIHALNTLVSAGTDVAGWRAAVAKLRA